MSSHWLILIASVCWTWQVLIRLCPGSSTSLCLVVYKAAWTSLVAGSDAVSWPYSFAVYYIRTLICAGFTLLLQHKRYPVLGHILLTVWTFFQLLSFAGCILLIHMLYWMLLICACYCMLHVIVMYLLSFCLWLTFSLSFWKTFTKIIQYILLN